jgi:hypothetical protein
MNSVHKFFLGEIETFCNNFKSVHLFIMIVKFANLECE